MGLRVEGPLTQNFISKGKFWIKFRTPYIP